MTSSNPEGPRSGLGATLRAALNAAVTAGVIIGLCDGLVAALGIDSSLFLTRWDLNGPVNALFSGLPAVREVPGLVGCVLGSAALHGLLGLLIAVPLGLGAHVFVRGRKPRGRHAFLLALVLGGWLGFELYWWTRPVVFPGLSAVDPRRLGAALALGLLGLAGGFVLVRLGARMPISWRRLAPFGVVLALFSGGLFLLLDAPGSRSRGVLNERNRDLPNVLMFVVDALRHDVLGCYGATDVETPHIDALAQRGVLFEEAFVQAPFTWTSFGSILTGKYPRRHGLVKMAPGVRMGPNITLPFYLQGATRRDGTELQEGDYLGGAFMTGTLSHGSGLLRGFDVYLEAMVGHGLVDVHSRWSRFQSQLLLYKLRAKFAQRLDAKIVASTTVDWLRENHDRRFVALVHYYSTHTPYDPLEPFRSQHVDPAYEGPIRSFDADARISIERGEYDPTPADEEQIRDLYRAGAAQADAMIGEVLAELQKLGTLDDTLVVVTSDHGEELGEHGLWEHNFMYQTNLRIPLVMAWPGRLPAGKRVPALVETVDLLPTICDVMGLELPRDPGLAERGVLDGVSLMPLVRGEVENVKPYSFAENGRYRSIHDLDRKLIVVRAALEEGGWEKLVAGELEAPRYFQLAEDPYEQRNLFEERRADARELYDALKEWSDSMPIGDHMIIESARDHERELFNALGYGGGVGQSNDPPDKPEDDPEGEPDDEASKDE